MSSLRRVRLWVPESDYDKDAVCCIAKKIVEFYKCELHFVPPASKQGFNDAASKPDGLKKAVKHYLKQDDLVIFLLDKDGVESQAQRRNQKNSLLNKIQAVVDASEGKAKLILMVQELEAWLLVDCLGICCYFIEKPKNRNSEKENSAEESKYRKNQKWKNFASRNQHGKTDLIAEAESGGRGVKEYLKEISKKILREKNPDYTDKDLKKLQYDENESYELAKYIEINAHTLQRNDSLFEFAQYLKQLAENKVDIELNN